MKNNMDNIIQRHEQSQTQRNPLVPLQLDHYYSNKKQLFKNKMLNLIKNNQAREIQYPIGTYMGEISPGNLKVVRHGEGIFFFKNGDAYFGGWINNTMSGYGIYLFDSGQKYEGEFRDNVKFGMGTYYYDQNSLYNGIWKNDLKEGFGVQDTPDCYYEGTWQNNAKVQAQYSYDKISNESYCGQFNIYGQKDGSGKLVMSDGSVYMGTFRNGAFNGIGELEYLNKDKYYGDFVNGQRHGTGKYFYSEGTVFQGIWENDEKKQGELTLFNGDVFKGIFRNNQRYSGIYTYKNGDIYEGCWLNQLKQGAGALFLHNGQEYRGNFEKGHKSGQGVYKWANGDVYEGQFYLDKRQGLGHYYWREGGYYKGQWSAERMNGFGRLVRDEIDLIGQFFADHFTREVEVQELQGLEGYIMG